MLRVEIIPLTGIPEIVEGSDLVPLIATALATHGVALAPTDVLVVTQKVVSKAEGCETALVSVEPSAAARAWGLAWDKDPRLIEIVLREAARIVRMDRGVIITETHHGFVCANAGVDASNARPGYVLTLPRDSDASAERLRAGLCSRTGVAPGVIVSDTFGRPWREGQVNVAIGAAGIRPLDDYRGRTDGFGRPLQASVLATADEIASAAELVMGKIDRVPAALVRGLDVRGEGTARALLRDPGHDLFR